MTVHIPGLGQAHTKFENFLTAAALKSTLFIPQISSENSVFLLTLMFKLTPLKLAISFERRLTFKYAEH